MNTDDTTLAPLATVAPLKKVVLLLEAGRQPGNRDLTDSPLHYKFIFGLGVEGLTPFEARLAGKQPGDILDLQVAAGDVAETFGHLCLPPAAGLSPTDTLYLRARVDAVTPAADREVVKAMAGGAGCGCDCGCGCSDHDSGL